VGAAWLIAATGCTILPLSGLSSGGCTGQLLATGDELGERCLAAVMEGVPAISAWISLEGLPDYVEARSGSALRMIYVESDRVVTFARDLLGTPAPTVVPRIRAADHERFKEQDKLRLTAVRGGTGIVRNAEPEEEAPSGILRRRVGQD
jgi:hypothetical protein